MDRRIMIPTVLLVLALSAFTAAGLYVMGAQPDSAGARTPQVPQASASPMPQLALNYSRPMSGDFADRRLAALGTRAPSIFIPSDGWRVRPPAPNSLLRVLRLGDRLYC